MNRFIFSFLALFVTAGSVCAQNVSQPAATIVVPVVITAGNTFQAITIPANRRSLTIENNNTNSDNCWITVTGSTDAKATAILLQPGGSYTRYFPYVPNGDIRATCTTTSDTLYVDYN